ncbi:MAG: HD domain-containing protein [Acidithiobacillus sp.]|nr:HD domain-containing protein [Acidithiobacillus sp.]
MLSSSSTPSSEPHAESTIHQGAVIAAVSFALDLTEGQPPGHSLRCAWMGMQIGLSLGLEEEQQTELLYSLLLKDAGCSSNAARLWELYGNDERLVKHDYKLVDNQNFLQLARFVFRESAPQDTLRNRLARILYLGRNGDKLATELVQTRCQRGAQIAKQLGMSDNVAMAIHCLDEQWNGKGRPEGLQGESIPLYSRIALLAQVMDVFHQTGGRHAALQEVKKRRGTWFDPALVRVVEKLAVQDKFWEGLQEEGLEARVLSLEPIAQRKVLTEDLLDQMAEVFASIVDIKSPYTHNHSQRVRFYADEVAQELGFSEGRRRSLRRAALLHDLGKLGVSNHILDKPGKLDEEEWAAIRLHPVYTEEVLSRIPGLHTIAKMAGAHHERLDGSGYPNSLHAEQISLDTRIVTLADFFDAITAARPYREAMPLAKALTIIQNEVGTVIDPECYAALHARVHGWGLA